MKRMIALVCVTLALPVALAHAGPPKPAKITYESAKKTAESKVPRGTLTSHELVRDHDKLVYGFEFAEAGKSGVKRVKVDAYTGKVLKVKHESIKGEQQEKAKEMRKMVAPS